MRILTVSFGYPDLINRVKYLFTHEQAISFKSRNIDIEALDLSSNNLKYEQEEFEGIPVHRLTKTSKNLISIIRNRNIISSILKENFDLILMSFISYQYIAYFDLFVKHGNKLAFTVHGADAMCGYESMLAKYTKRYLLNKADYIFSVSEYTDTMVSVLQKRNSISCLKSYVVYNGVSEEKLDKVKWLTQEKCKLDLNIPNDTYNVLAICDLVKRKGVDLLIEAIFHTVSIIPNIRLTIIGRGPEEERLKNLVKSLNIEKNIMFIRYIEDDELLVKYYKASDIYSMVSKTIYEDRATEGFGISYIEASYLGIPVIAGNNGGSFTAVKHGFTGYLVNPYHRDCSLIISKYIERIYKSKDLHKYLSTNAIKNTAEMFTWSNNTSQILEIFNNENVRK